MGQIEHEFRVNSSKPDFLAKFDWDPVSAVRGTVVYRLYIAEDEEGWYLLVSRYMEHELFFLAERCYGPYDERQQVLDLAAWIARPSPFGVPAPSWRLVSVIDSYVYAAGQPFDPDCWLQPARDWQP